MKGLFIKDMRLMMQQKRFFALLLALTIVLSFNSENKYFAIGYLTFISAFFTISSINYDEADNGFSFLFALPFQRKEYVKEKYLFGALLGVAAWCVGFLITFYRAMQVGSQAFAEYFCTSLVFIPLMLLMLAVMLPVQMKFGAERGRIMLIVIFGAMCACAFALDKICEASGFDYQKIIDGLLNIRSGVIVLPVFVAAIVVTLISCKISTAIMERKEY